MINHEWLVAVRIKTLFSGFLALGAVLVLTAFGLRSGIISGATLQSASMIVSVVAICGFVVSLWALNTIRRMQKQMAVQLEAAVSALSRKQEADHARIVLSMGLLEERVLRSTEAQALLPEDEKPDTQASAMLIDGATLMQERRNRVEVAVETLLESARNARLTLPISLQPVIQTRDGGVAAFLAQIRLHNHDALMDGLEIPDAMGSELSILAAGRCIRMIKDHFLSDAHPQSPILCPLHSGFFKEAKSIGNFIDLLDRDPAVKQLLIPVVRNPAAEITGTIREAIHRLNHAGVKLGVFTGSDMPAGWLGRIACWHMAESRNLPDPETALAHKKSAAKLRASLVAVNADLPEDMNSLADWGIEFFTSKSLAAPRLVRNGRPNAAVA